MAGGLSELPVPAPAPELPAEVPAQQPAAASAAVLPRVARAHRSRFLSAYLALGLVLGAAVAATAVVLTRPGAEATGPWSAWRPIARGSEKVNEIAKYVAGRYRLPGGRQLVGVIASPPQFQEVQVNRIAILTGLRRSFEDIRWVSADGAVMYLLCGLGESCSISEGKPSVERARLVRREALELALYTFRYVGGIDSVLAVMPPPPPQPGGQPEQRALFFRRDDFRPQLKGSLLMTLPREKPPLANQIDAKEGKTIDDLTALRLFRYQLVQDPQGGAILVLDPSL